MIYIKELLPNPVGSDTEGEWITLINQGGESASLKGWKLGDESGKIFLLNNKEIPPQQELKLQFSETKISLNNNGDAITLYNSDGKQVDELSYAEASEGETILSARFKEVSADGGELAANAVKAGSHEIITNDYGWWPLGVGILVAVIAGYIAGFILKKIYKAV